MIASSVAGCGLYVPEKDVFQKDLPQQSTAGQISFSPQGAKESNIVAHVRCEIRNGVYNALKLRRVPWLAKYGATVSLKLTWDEMGGATPGLSFLNPLKNSQSFALGLGATGTSHATRLETITYTYSNAELVDEAMRREAAHLPLTCEHLENGVMVDSDLEIGQFIYDKASIATSEEAQSSTQILKSPFSIFQEEITFVASVSGNITPTWKLTRVAANTTGTLLSATRSNTNDLIITVGPLAQSASKNSPALLDSSAQDQHLAAFAGSATATAILSQAH